LFLPNSCVTASPKKQKWRKREACANSKHLSLISAGKHTRSKLYAIQDVTVVQHEVHSFLSKYWNNHSTMVLICQTKPVKCCKLQNIARNAIIPKRIVGNIGIFVVKYAFCAHKSFINSI